MTDLVRELAGRGFAVHVVCSRQLYDDSAVRLPRQEQAFGARVHRVATTHFGRRKLLGRACDYATFYISAATVLLVLLRRGDVLVVKTDPPLMSLLAAPLAALKRVALVNWQQDVFPEIATHLRANPLPRWLDRFLRRLRNASLRASRMNVVIGSRMQDYFAAGGIPQSKLRVIENWADAEAIKPKPPDASALRAQLGLGDHFVACYSGNLGRAHEFDTLLSAAQALKADQQFVFLIIGGGIKMEALQQAVADLALQNFRFLPYQPRDSLEDSLAAADVHLVSLLPALEGLIVPSKLYGILAAGRPLIFIGDLDGDVARVIGEGDCGISVSVGNAGALADALRYLRATPQVRAGMGTRARHLLCEKYTLRDAVERWVALLSGLQMQRNHPIESQVRSDVMKL